MASLNVIRARGYVAFPSLHPQLEVLIFGILGSGLSYAAQELVGVVVSAVVAFGLLAAYVALLVARYRRT